jgi:hypothetical protein
VTEQDIDDLADTLIGTCLTLDEALGMRGLSCDHTSLEAKLELHNCAKCKTCDWWFEATDLNDDGECVECLDG